MIRELFLQNLSFWGFVWQSTLFAVIGLVGSFLLRRRPARACQVLFLAMIAAMLVPTMSVLVKHFELGMFEAEPIALKPEVVVESVAIDYGTSVSVSPPEVSIGARELASAKAGSGVANIPWRMIVLYGWMIATLILLGRLLVAFVSGVCLLRRAQSWGCEQIQRAADSAKVRLGITKDIQVRSSKDVRSPVIWCWGPTPVLLVPGDLDHRVDWVGVISHELAHWRRWDHISGLIAELIVCVLSWNPLLWWSKKRMVRLSEQACDDWVIAGGQPCEDYAQSLLNFKPQKQVAFVPAVVTSKKTLAGRVRRILQDSCGNPRTGAVWALAVSIMAASLAVGVACAQTRPAKPSEAEEEPLTASPARANDSDSRTKLNKILDAMLYHDKSVMPIAMHVEIEMYNLDKPTDSQHYSTYSFEQRLDGLRLDSAMTVYHIEDGKRSRTQENRRVFTGNQYVYRQQIVDRPGRRLLASLESVKEAKRIMAYYHLWGGVLLGYLDGDQKPVASILKDSLRVTLQDQMEEVGGFACYVVEGKTDHGAYKIWIDPEYNYRIRKSVVHKEPGDMYFGKPIPKDAPEDRWATATLHMDISDVKLEKIGDHFIPTAETRTATRMAPDGSKYRGRMVVKRSKVDLHPDFEKLGAFVMDGIPEGTRVNNSDPESYGYEYEWRDGKVVPVGDGGTIFGRIQLTGDVDLDTILAGKNQFRATIRPMPATKDDAKEAQQHSIELRVTEDGSFRIENVPPGQHLLHISLRKFSTVNLPSGGRGVVAREIGIVNREFSISEKADEVEYESLNLDVLKMSTSGSIEPDDKGS